MKFWIISPVRNAEEQVRLHMQSVKNQVGVEYTHIVIDDFSTDDTNSIIDYEATDNTEIIVNTERLGVPRNHKYALEYIADRANSEDIVVHLDGDDNFVDQSVLLYLQQTYTDEQCWLTYGSYKASDGARCVAREYTGHPRQAVLDGWPFSHLRTFKYGLSQILTEDNWKDRDGEWYDAAADVVMFVPILEKIGYTRVKFIDKVLVNYISDTGLNEATVALQEQVRTAYDIIQK